MPTENNWMYCNLDKRISDPFIDFKVAFNPTPFKKISFEQASIESANKIANKYDNIFISLSGGLDSEYIMLTLYNLKIPFKPIIVVADKANELEVQYAFHMCKKINIEPKVINCSEFEFFNIFKYSIFNKMNGKGIYTTPIIITGKYVEDRIKNQEIKVILPQQLLLAFLLLKLLLGYQILCIFARPFELCCISHYNLFHHRQGV